MASSVQYDVSDVDDYLKCSLCTKLLQNPRTLSCTHSFCLRCLQLYSKLTGVDATIICTVCESETPIPTNGIETLNCVELLTRMLQKSASEVKLQSNAPNCNVCETNVSSKFCKTCVQHLCTECELSHSRIPASAEHELITASQSQASKSSVMCKQCEENEAEKFCPVCDQPICLKCADLHKRIPATKSHELTELTPRGEIENCGMCENVSSTVYCEECKQHICDSCIKVHSKIPATRSHVVVPNAKVLKKTPDLALCVSHPSSGLEFYCVTCKNLICQECVITTHNKHNRISKISQPSIPTKKQFEKVATMQDSSQESKTDMTKKEIPDHRPTVQVSPAVKNAPDDPNKLIPLTLPDKVIIKRAALGQKVFLGQLYDEQTGHLLPDAIFKCKSNNDEIEVSNEISTETKVFDPKSLVSKTEALRLNDRDKIDVLLNYVKAKGHSEVILDAMPSSNVKVGGLLLSITKRKESLNHINLGTFHDRKTAVTTKNIQATHVVIGIDWGFSAALLAENLKHEEIVPDITQNDIDSMLNCISGRLSGNSHNFGIDAVSTKDISIRLFHDQLPSHCDEPVNDDEKIDLFCAFQTKVVMLNDDELFPVSYYLANLEHIYNVADGTSIDVSNLSANGIDKSLSAIVIDYLQKIEEVKGEIRDARKRVHKYEKCLVASEIQKIDRLRKDLFETEQSFKKSAKNDISCFRTRVRNTSNAVALQLSNMQTYNKSLDKLIQSCVEPMKETDKKIVFLEELKSKKIKYFGFNTTRAELINYTTRGDHMVLFFDMKSSNFCTVKDAFFGKIMEFCYPENMFESYSASQSTNSGVQFAAVDREMCPKLAEEENIGSGSHICWYENGVCDQRNIEEDILKEKELNLAKSDMEHKNLDSQPMSRALVRIACPNAFNGICSIEKHDWLCYSCKKVLQYDVTNKTFYCGCGCAPVTSYRFRCGSNKHGSDFIQFDKKRLENELSSLAPAKEITILILGETGVGKSTWINSIVNYINFETLQEARDVEGIPFLIPTTFSVLDDNYVSRKISVEKKGAKQSDTEVLSDNGQSATQDVKAYRFQARDVNVQLIDTPGIGDVRGPDQDKENFDKILRFLSTITELHGICILLKPNESRLTLVFRYCITELLTHLHRSAAANIIFCFTNARGTFYKPGDSLVPLRALLESKKTGNQGVDIQTKLETMYCLDNEAFRFLCAVRQGIPFSQDDVNNFSTSWTKSRNETVRLFDYILHLKPHSLIATLSLNEARNIILNLTKPVAEMSRNIQINITAVNRKKEELKSLDLRDKDLKKKLYIPQISLEAKPVDHPTTVCTAKKCTETRQIKGATESRVHYKTVCHCPCQLKTVKPEVIADPGLRECGAMRNGICTVCACTWDLHMHIKYTFEEVAENVLDTHTQDLIKKGASSKEIIQSLVKEMEERIDELEKSKKQIAEITAKFGSFLKSNAIVPYNDDYEEYLQLKIREEKDIASLTKSDVTLKSLEQYLALYKEQVDILNQQMDDTSSCKLAPEDIVKLRDELYSIQGKGEELKKVAEVVRKTSLLNNSQQNSTYYETFVSTVTYAAKEVRRGYRRFVSGKR